MRLKSLSLFGFKSFAQRTELVFAPGITAIVGPNGSGKSNVLDAIVWVLGERSTKALRSFKAADLLFAGNGKVKPASLAEVALLLELDGNERNGHPETDLFSALSELVIARRLKRTGESQFSINRVPCRLRDVQDLLLELGISSDSYAFIGQAEIDRLVFLTPQERRAVLEQVAGVHRFQLRREDAIEKLERTQRNLTRLRDLVAELHRQRDMLTTEVEKARRYGQLLNRRRELQIALLGWEHQVRLRRTERLREERTALEQLVARTDEHIAAANAERQATDTALSRMEESLQELQTQASQALEEAKALENELSLCQERQKHLTQRRTDAERQKAALAERRQRWLAELTEAKQRLDALQQQRLLFNQQEAELQIQLEQEQQTVADLERQLQDAHEEHFEAERALAETRSQLSSLDPLLQTLRARNGELQQERAAMQERLTQLQRQCDELTARHSSLIADDLVAAIRTLQGQIAEQTQQSEALRHRLHAVREQLAATRARLAALEEMEMSLTGVPQGARTVLLAVRDGKLKGEFYLLAHLIRVPKGLEIAYESALGAAANYLVAKTFAEVQDAIDYLKRHNAGRATFLALDFLSELSTSVLHPSSPVPFEGVIGWADELVQVLDERFADAVRHVLRNTLLVEDLTIARRLAPQIRGVRFVTRSGEVIAPSGTIAGGATVQSAGSFFLRQREREELATRVRQLETQAREWETQQQTAEQRLAVLHEELTQVQRQHEERQRLLERVNDELQRLTVERERWHREEQRLHAEGQRLQREMAQLQQDAETLTYQIQRLSADCDAAQNRIRQLQADIAEATKRKDELAKQWQQAQMAAAQWQAQYDALQRRVGELTDALNETDQQSDALTQELQTLEWELAALTERLPILERQWQECHQRREEAEAALSNWREQRKALIQHRDELERQLETLTAQRNEQSEELHRCEVRLTQAEAELSEIERRLTDEFSVSVETAHAAAEQLEQKQTALEELERVKQEMAAMGEVQLGVLDEYERLNERIAFLQDQIADLETARLELLSNLDTLEQQFKERFREVLTQVNDTFNEMVQRFWRGGEGRLVLNEGQTLAESGVEVKVRLPGKAEQDLLSLSGGEKAIVGLCLLFAFLKINPAPFVLLDEVDAPLDDSNTDRFVGLLREFAERTQFIVITHNPITVQAADHLYGVTIEEQGVSKVLSLSLKEALAWTEQS